MAKPIVGVMGPGEGASDQETRLAAEIGKLIASENWILLTGGRNVGVMEAASKGAQQAGGLVVGILPADNKDDASAFIDVPIRTGMGSARNNINVLSSDVIVACGNGAGTTSEIMLALKSQKPLILLHPSPTLVDFIGELSYPEPYVAETAERAISILKNIL